MRRDQQFLLPPDMREWLPPGHLVWFVLDVVSGLDTAGFHRRRGNAAGRAGFDPDMLLALLVYAYCRGVRSSRQVERLCETDVAFRVICALDVPDHTVIARFRQHHGEAFVGLFGQVLAVAARAGLGRFGTVAIDGTKIAANASLDANRSEEWLREQAGRITAEAAAVDAAEDAEFGAEARGDEAPPELADPTSRRARIAAALAEVAAERAAAEQADADAAAKAERRIAAIAEGARPTGRDPKGVDAVAAARLRLDRLIASQQAALDAYAAASAAGRRPRGGPPAPIERHARIRNARAALARALAAADKPTTAEPDAQTRRHQANTTDPQSRIMPTRNGWVQGYNVQLAVTSDQLILAATVGQNPTDTSQFIPMMTAAQTAAQTFHHTGRPDAVIGTVLADAGYASHTNLTAPGPNRLIALGKTHKTHHAAKTRPAHGDPPQHTNPREAMDHRLRTEQGATLYKRRAATVEPAIGNLKKIINRFARRGLAAATTEIHLAATAFNLLKIHRTQPTT